MKTDEKQQKIVSKTILCFIIVLALIITGVSHYMKRIYIPKTVLRTAIKESELVDKKYILCKEAVTTGFKWIMVKDEDGQQTQTYCNVVGAQPFVDFKLKHEFRLAYNTFVFYVEEIMMVYSEATKQEEPQYIVTGWDILYPVKHNSFIDLISSKRYITENDLWKD